MGPSKNGESLAAVEQSLRRSVALNQEFAPAYALLAEVTAYRSGDHARALVWRGARLRLSPVWPGIG